MRRLRLIEDLESSVEASLWENERSGEMETAMAVYEEAIDALRNLGDAEGEVEERRNAALSYALLRAANVRRQQGRPDDARRLDDEGLDAARRSGDNVALGRALLSTAGTAFGGGETARGLALLDEARLTFEAGESDDHRQGLGWTLILRVDVANAGLIAVPDEALLATTAEGLDVLTPIANHAGIARLHDARATILERQGRGAASAEERTRAALAEAAIESK